MCSSALRSLHVHTVGPTGCHNFPSRLPRAFGLYGALARVFIGDLGERAGLAPGGLAAGTQLEHGPDALRDSRAQGGITMSEWKRVQVALAGAIFLAAGVASAHELDCDKKVRLGTEGDWTGAITLNEADFGTDGADVQWLLVVRNGLDDKASDVLSLEDDFLEEYLDYEFPPQGEDGIYFTLAPFHAGDTCGDLQDPAEDDSCVQDIIDQTIASLDECERLANEDGTPNDHMIINKFMVDWDDGFKICPAKIICGEKEEDGGECTRSPGFWKTHFTALDTCFEEVDFSDFGPFDIDETGDLAAILWANQLDGVTHAQLKLAQALIATMCGAELIAGDPSEDLQDAIEAGLDALNGNGDLEDAKDALEEFYDGQCRDEWGSLTPENAQPKLVCDLGDDSDPYGGDLHCPGGPNN